MAENGHYRHWLNNPVSMYAPRQYIIPELRKVLIVTPRHFGAHFLPLYNRDLILNYSNDAYIKLRRRLGHVGIQYLVAHCHGVSTRQIEIWTGKTKVEIHKDVMDSLDGFINTIPYWIWAYKVDMTAIPFTQNKNSKMTFRNRLKVWNMLNECPQLANPWMAERFMPQYIRDPRAISALKKKSPMRAMDKFLLPVPKKHTPDNPILKTRTPYRFGPRRKRRQESP